MTRVKLRMGVRMAGKGMMVRGGDARVQVRVPVRVPVPVRVNGER